MTASPLPARVGERIALRVSAADGPREVVGEVLSCDAETLVVLPDGRPPQAIALPEVAAARAVPPRAVRPASPIEDLEALTTQGWPGAEQERLGGWLLRAGSGGSRRANSALPLGDPGMSVTAALSALTEWYAARGLRPCAQLPQELGPRMPSFRRRPDELEDALTQAAWVAQAPTLVLVGDVRRMPPRAAAYPLRLDWADEPGQDWWALDRSDEARRAEALAAPARYLSVREQSGALIATGRLALVRDWCGLSNLTVAAATRGRGHGRRALEAMLAEGARAGARFAYLQVEEANVAALALYESHGLLRHHRYRYLAPA